MYGSVNCYPPETITTLLISYTLIQKMLKNIKIKKGNHVKCEKKKKTMNKTLKIHKP